ncbi:hypothetical protein [Chitinivibrio alkaliphilus]|uniref:DUF5723 domain-containing protein n=1 Tax=Chitinivibrio alkaliphilus ACht1 TaxID=1313304 RepID=U7D8N1_9BACT|nr:hypothetical protein [Chitinivibrio alkaliphilus]ERP38759.1 hypothetical protein CALK_0778 [Chitinivibrio alkaliphilus ACht1]
MKLILLFIFFAGVLISHGNETEIDGLDFLPTPDVSAEFSIGINYDFLRTPLAHSFERSRGFWGVNIPIPLKMSDEMMSDLTSPISKYFTDGELFVPDVVVRQFANTSIMVEVPMLGGVCSFSNIDMLNIKYGNRFSLPSSIYSPPDTLLASGDEGDVSMLLRSSLEVPLGFSLGWETTTFGYLYHVENLPQDLFLSLNLTRHHTYFDVTGNVNINVAGNISIEEDGGGITLSPDYQLNNNINGYYSLDRWSPTLAAQFWRFFTIARFGFSDEAEGHLDADYSVPFFVDEETFQFSDSLGDPDLVADYVFNNRDDFNRSRTRDVRLSTTNDLLWEMPHGFTFGFEVIPEKLRLSYTKVVNDVHLSLFDDTYSGDHDFVNDTIDFRVSAHVDHMINLKGDFGGINFTLGVFSFDVTYNDDEYIIRSIIDEGRSSLPTFGDGTLIPVLNGGAVVGQEFQLMGELNLLPIPSIKTGVVYNF